MVKIFLRLIFLGLLVLFICFSGMYVDSGNSNDFRANVGVIYGNKVELTGQPSPRLEARLKAGMYLYKSDLVGKLIVSGGTGKEGHDEAKVMANYLLSAGIDKGDILIDSNGYNTSMTSISAFELVGANSSVVAISQKYHISRAKMSLRNSGFEEVYGFSPDYIEFRDIYAYLREMMAWFKYWFFNL